jgi:hypothetical protein
MVRSELGMSLGYFFLVASMSIPLMGCGSREGAKLIEPTVEYQLTEQEQINRAAVEAARAGDR